MIIRDMKGRELALSVTQLTQLRNDDCLRCYLVLTDLAEAIRHPKQSLFVYYGEPTYELGLYISITIFKSRVRIGCATFSISVFKQIAEAAGLEEKEWRKK